MTELADSKVRGLRVLSTMMAIAFIFLIGWIIWRETRRPAPQPPPPKSDPAALLAQAESLHAVLPMIPPSDAEKRTGLIENTLAAYRGAGETTDSHLKARALFGQGQVLLVSGDTFAALGVWTQAARLNSDSFQTLRAMKSLADVDADTAARLWARRILDDYDTGTMTQQTEVIVTAARKMLR